MNQPMEWEKRLEVAASVLPPEAAAIVREGVEVLADSIPPRHQHEARSKMATRPPDDWAGRLAVIASIAPDALRDEIVRDMEELAAQWSAKGP